MAPAAVTLPREAMCDEYDDERMRVFWRQLAVQEERTSQELEPEAAIEPIGQPVGEVGEPKRAKPRALVH